MTEAQRVGQLFIVGIAGDPNSVIAPAVATYHFGLAAIREHEHRRRVGAPGHEPGRPSMATAQATAKTGSSSAPTRRAARSSPSRALAFHHSVGSRAGASPRRPCRSWLPTGVVSSRRRASACLAPVLDVVPTATQEQNQPIGVLDREHGPSRGP